MLHSSNCRSKAQYIISPILQEHQDRSANSESSTSTVPDRTDVQDSRSISALKQVMAFAAPYVHTRAPISPSLTHIIEKTHFPHSTDDLPSLTMRRNRCFRITFPPRAQFAQSYTLKLAREKHCNLLKPGKPCGKELTLSKGAPPFSFTPKRRKSSA